MVTTKAKAMKDLLIEEIDGLNRTKDKVFEFFMEHNLSKTVISYIQKLWGYTQEVGGSVVAIGKIIINKIITFIQENKNMAFGMALGAIAGAMVSVFVGWIPFLGQALSAITIGGGMLIGAISGNRMDRAEKGEFVDDGVLAVFGDAIAIAKKFIMLFADIIQSIRNH